MSIPKQIEEVLAKASCLYARDDVERALDEMAKAIHNKLEKNIYILQ